MCTKKVVNRPKTDKKTLYAHYFAILTHQNRWILEKTALGGLPTRTRAPSNSDLVFLLSQVSHTSSKTLRKTTTPNLYVTVYFPPSFLYFNSPKANKP